MVRVVAAVAAAAAIVCGVGGCALTGPSVDAAPARTAAPTADPRPPQPTRHPTPPLPAPVDSTSQSVPPPPATSAPLPATSGPLPADLTSRISAALSAGSVRGADVTVALLDRVTGRRYGAADAAEVETASVAKLFIADAVLHDGDDTGADRDLIARMLERSDDDAANELWIGHGGPAVIRDVADRYGLGATTPPWDGNWWNTESTADDLVDWYTGLLAGRGGLGAAAAETILGHLRAATPLAADGYDQRFGVPDALSAQPVGEVAVKQGWMCCTVGRWVHLSTAVVGPDSRYVLVVTSRETVDYDDDGDVRAIRGRHTGNDGNDGEQSGTATRLPDTSVDSAVDDVSAAHARRTMTEVVRILFPEGRIG